MTDPDYPTDPHVDVPERFVVIPEDLLHDTAVSADAVRVYGVLLRHGSDPANCYPSHRRIGDLIGRSSRSVPVWIKELEVRGWVERIARQNPDGSPTSNGYRVHARRAVERGVYAAQRVSLLAAERGTSPLHSAPNESQVNESNLERELTLLDDAPESAPPPPGPLAGFEEFWVLYPRSVAKGAARKAWPRAVAAAGGTDPILAGARRYAIEREREDPKFTAHPSTWLNQERWGDAPTRPVEPTGPLGGVDTDRSGESGRAEM